MSAVQLKTYIDEKTSLSGLYSVFNYGGQYVFVNKETGVQVSIPYDKVDLGRGDFSALTPDKIQTGPPRGGRRRKTKKFKRRSRKTRRYR